VAGRREVKVDEWRRLLAAVEHAEAHHPAQEVWIVQVAAGGAGVGVAIIPCKPV